MSEIIHYINDKHRVVICFNENGTMRLFQQRNDVIGWYDSDDCEMRMKTATFLTIAEKCNKLATLL